LQFSFSSRHHVAICTTLSHFQVLFSSSHRDPYVFHRSNITRQSISELILNISYSVFQRQWHTIFSPAPSGGGTEMTSCNSGKRHSDPHLLLAVCIPKFKAVYAFRRIHHNQPSPTTVIFPAVSVSSPVDSASSCRTSSIVSESWG
jgi:hypothetical protein